MELGSISKGVAGCRCRIHSGAKQLFFFSFSADMAPTYESLSQSLRRSINCLVDGDRRLRTEGIITIKKGIETAVYQGGSQSSGLATWPCLVATVLLSTLLYIAISPSCSR